MTALIVVLAVLAALLLSTILFPTSSESEKVVSALVHEHPMHTMKSINR